MSETNTGKMLVAQIAAVSLALLGNFLIACKYEPLAALGFTSFLLTTFINMWIYYKTRLLVMMGANFLFLAFNIFGIYNNLFTR